MEVLEDERHPTFGSQGDDILWLVNVRRGEGEGEIPEDDRHDDLCFDDAEALAGAGSRAKRERQQRVWVRGGSGDAIAESQGVELVGVGAPHLPVPLQQADGDRYHGPLGHLDALEHDVRGGRPLYVHDRRVEPQCLQQNHVKLHARTSIIL